MRVPSPRGPRGPGGPPSSGGPRAPAPGGSGEPGWPGAPALPLGSRRFTVEEYHRMGALGLLDQDDRVELLDGQVVAMTPAGPQHVACVVRLADLLARRLESHTKVSVQNPLVLSERSQPQPDIAVIRRAAGFGGAWLPEAKDALLVVEVADSSLERDREVKLPLYAQAGIPEVWLVNLLDQQVETYREPTGERYGKTHLAGRGEVLTPILLPGVSVSVDRILD